MNHQTKVLEIKEVAKHIYRVRLTKPKNYTYNPGQSASLFMNNKPKPLTFTSVLDDNFLEVMIKTYDSSAPLPIVGSELVITDPYGIIEYKGLGVFFAGGIGITPFIAILRDLHSKKLKAKIKLFYSNKTSDEIVIEDELKNYLKKNLILTLTQEKKQDYHFGRINKGLLQKHISDFNQYFYFCGPSAFKEAIKKALLELGVSKEKFIG